MTKRKIDRQMNRRNTTNSKVKALQFGKQVSHEQKYVYIKHNRKNRITREEEQEKSLVNKT